MNEVDEFKVLSMLENLPDLKSTDKTHDKMSSFLTELEKEEYKPNRMNVSKWLSIAASIIMFVFGYGIAYQAKESKQLKEIKNEYQNTQRLLLRNAANNSSPSDRLASIQYLVNSLSKGEVAKELITLIKVESNENVKLALIDLISSYSDVIEVQDLLASQLMKEDNPLIAISIINVLSKEKIKKGLQILKNYQSRDSIHPTIKNHLNYLKA